MAACFLSSTIGFNDPGLIANHRLIKSVHLPFKSVAVYFNSKKIFLIIFFAVFPNGKLFSQKIYFSFSTELHQSFGKELYVNKEIPGYSINEVSYHERKRYQYPYVNLLVSATKVFSKKLEAVIETGIYINYMEQYYFGVRLNTLRYNFQAGGNYIFLNRKQHKYGVTVKGGFFIQDIHQGYFRYGNALLYNASFFIQKNRGGKVKIGVEKNINFMAIPNVLMTMSGERHTYNYTLKRLSLFVGYSFWLGGIQ